MDYFKILDFDKEPFSNSPDPEFFFQSRVHLGCLQKLELSIRLRRGLNVVIGDVGTGKTTLCRELIRRFAADETIETHLILDPNFSAPSEFLSAVAEMFSGYGAEKRPSDWQLKEVIKQYLFRRGVDEKKTVVLIIDEGQKMPGFCLEILREFLNYETNEYKLLQIFIFAQKEFQQTLKDRVNFAYRINLYHCLSPLNFQETRLMIRFRLKQASVGSGNLSLFTYPALWAIYRATGGYPRKIINLCHRIILTLIIQNRSRAGWSVARSCTERIFLEQTKKWQRIRIGVLTGLLVVAILVGLGSERLTTLLPWQRDDSKMAFNKGEAPFSKVIKVQIQDTPPEIKEAVSQTAARVEPEEVARATTAAEASSELLEEAVSPPGFLGQIAAREQETLGGMIHKVYGIFNSQYLESVTQVNQQIKDPDLIEIGDVIRFPAIPVKPDPLPEKVWWVQVATKERLQDAYQFLRTHSSITPPMRMIPCWNSREGLRFKILLKDYFADEESARSSLKGLAVAVASGAKVLAEWDGDTIFFANLIQTH